jgi:hypothetical protein
MEYTLVVSNNRKEFIEEVNKLIKNGWLPQGGICESGTDTSGSFYSQAMIRNVENKD